MYLHFLKSLLLNPHKGITPASKLEIWPILEYENSNNSTLICSVPRNLKTERHFAIRIHFHPLNHIRVDIFVNPPWINNEKLESGILILILR